MPIAVHCGVPKVLYREGLVGLLPKVCNGYLLHVANFSSVYGLHELIGKHLHCAARARIMLVVFGAEPMRELLARVVVAHEERAGSVVDVTALVSHVRTVADMQ